jgi:biopolymer transport protein TolQ
MSGVDMSLWQNLVCLSQGSIFRLILDASPFAKVILVILLGFSVVSWAVIIDKLRFFKAAARYSEMFTRRFHEGARLEELSTVSRQIPAGPYSRILLEAISHLPTRSERGSGAASDALQQDDVVRVRSAMNRTAGAEISKMESHLPFLATTGSVTPFVGLLGTVWGVMSAFLGMGVRGSATLAVVAPGIAEALIATVAGLAAAIPAVIAYNYFLSKVRTTENEMGKFVSEFCDRLATGAL